MESKVSEILENILSLLALEGSFEVTEKEDGVFVTIDTEDAGRLIGHQGETLGSLQLLVNQILSKQVTQEKDLEYKRVIIDISNWRRSKEEDLANRAKRWAEQVKESGQEMELDPMPSWQRRIIHMVIQETDGVESESIGEGIDRHLVIKPAGKGSSTDDSKDESEEA